MDSSIEFCFNTSSILSSQVMENTQNYTPVLQFANVLFRYSNDILQFVDHFQLKHEIEDLQFDQNIVEHFEIYMVLINPIFEEKIPKSIYFIPRKLDMKNTTPQKKKKKKECTCILHI